MSRFTVPDAIWPTDNTYEIPSLSISHQADAIDSPFVAWGSVSRVSRMTGTWHFYVDDYRFTALLKRPDLIIDTGCISVVEPNFSMLQQMPLAVGLFRLYQKRWLSRYWQQHGIRILVDLNVSPKFRAYNFLGVPRGWNAYATRGYTNRMTQLEAEYRQAAWHAEQSPLFVVYGGGKRVKEYCLSRDWLWFSEQADIAKERMNDAKR